MLPVFQLSRVWMVELQTRSNWLSCRAIRGQLNLQLWRLSQKLLSPDAFCGLKNTTKSTWVRPGPQWESLQHSYRPHTVICSAVEIVRFKKHVHRTFIIHKSTRIRKQLTVTDLFHICRCWSERTPRQTQGFSLYVSELWRWLISLVTWTCFSITQLVSWWSLAVHLLVDDVYTAFKQSSEVMIDLSLSNFQVFTVRNFCFCLIAG